MSFLSQLLPEKQGPTPTWLLASARLQVTSYRRQADQTCQNPSRGQEPEGATRQAGNPRHRAPRGPREAPQPPTPFPCQHSKSARGSWARPLPPPSIPGGPGPKGLVTFREKPAGYGLPRAQPFGWPSQAAGQDKTLPLTAHVQSPCPLKPRKVRPSVRGKGGCPSPTSPTGQSQRGGRWPVLALREKGHEGG